MKRLMVMGAAVEQLPGIKKAKEMGFEVAVADYNPNAVGIPFADKYYNVSTIDKDALLLAAKDFKPDGFLTLATDMPMKAVAYVCKELGINAISPETALKATDKGEMIKALKAHNVASPLYYIVKEKNELKDVLKEIEYPFIMKPTDNAASRGVVLIKGKDELYKAYDYSKSCSKTGTVIIEEYMQGDEVSVEVLTYDGVPYVLAVTDKMTTGAPHFVELGHNQYSLHTDSEIEKIKQTAIDAVLALGIQTGPSHVEIMLTNEGPKIVELGARLGGDCITSHLVYLSTGVDMVKETIKVLCGEKPDLTPKYKKGAAIRFLIAEKEGVLDRVEGFDEAKKTDGIVEVSMIMQKGDKLTGGVNSSDDRVAFVIAQDDTPSLAIKHAEDALSKLVIVEQ